MNREQLEARKAEFTVHRANNAKELAAARDRVTYLQATDNTLHGVVQDCDHWLSFVAPAPAPLDLPPATGSTARTATESAALVDVLKGRKAKREGAAA